MPGQIGAMMGGEVGGAFPGSAGKRRVMGSACALHISTSLSHTRYAARVSMGFAGAQSRIGSRMGGSEVHTSGRTCLCAEPCAPHPRVAAECCAPWSRTRALAITRKLAVAASPPELFEQILMPWTGYHCVGVLRSRGVCVCARVYSHSLSSACDGRAFMLVGGLACGKFVRGCAQAGQGARRAHDHLGTASLAEMSPSCRMADPASTSRHAAPPPAPLESQSSSRDRRNTRARTPNKFQHACRPRTHRSVHALETSSRTNRTPPPHHAQRKRRHTHTSLGASSYAEHSAASRQGTKHFRKKAHLYTMHAAPQLFEIDPNMNIIPRGAFWRFLGAVVSPKVVCKTQAPTCPWGSRPDNAIPQCVSSGGTLFKPLALSHIDALGLARRIVTRKRISPRPKSWRGS